MHSELLQMAAELARGEEPFVLAVVVRRRPASSSQAGDMALITAAGEFHGWLGGSCTQPTVVREAQRALADGRPRLVALSPDPEADRRPGVAVFPMTCHSGGSVEIYLEPVLPPPRLVVFGASPTARALAELGRAAGYSVVQVAAPAAAGDAAGETLARAPCFAVVATMGEGDEAAIRGALGLRPAYLGVVASGRRFAQIRQSLLAGGVAAAALDAIRSPAGIAIGAQTPQEIAVSVLAEVIAQRRAAAATALGEAGAGAGAGAEVASLPDAVASRPGAAQAGPGPSPGPGAADREAIDPICGMAVEVAGARHTARHAGRTYYFCGGGCRERFLAAPERFAAPRPPERSEGAA
jgi:xanthine dehydrogenase accessory factor